MLRTNQRTDFTQCDADLLQAVSTPVAVALRRAARRPGAGAGVTFDAAAAGVLILDRQDQVVSVNDAARLWLDEFGCANPTKPAQLPMAVYAVAEAIRARSHTTFSQSSPEPPLLDRHAHARVRTGSGRWLTLQASSLAGGEPSDSGNIAVVIDAAPRSDIAQLLMLAYALTPRERQVLQRVISGASSTAIAAQLQISANTVQDHLKSGFAKVGVRSRGQLVAHVLGERYL
jgi:DNA-binding CsgD family transcriptional regulator